MGLRRRVPAYSLLLAVGWLLIAASQAMAERWSFAAISDHRDVYASYRNVLREIKALTVNVRPKFPPVGFVLDVGDLSPAAANYRIYQEVFPNPAPVFVPVRGNHETAADVDFILRTILPGIGSRLHAPARDRVQYYMDWNNARLIVLDQYVGWPNALINPETLRWLESAITSATHADHVFIAFHAPRVPKKIQGDVFWDVLLRHRDRVRAVFTGHTHVHERRKIGKEGGHIDLINLGNAGQQRHSDNQQTIVEVMVDGQVVFYRAIQALDGTDEFRLAAEWDNSAPKKDPPTGPEQPGAAGAGDKSR